MPAMTPVADLRETVSAARAAQARWRETPIATRLGIVRRLRHAIAAHPFDLARTIARDPGETLTAEILPLAEACRFLEREAESLLAPRRLGAQGRPIWLGGVDTEIRREPLGVVLVIGPANYPLFLPAVQTVQALAAGNAVVLKPGDGGWPAAAAFTALCHDAGIPRDLLVLTTESRDDAQAAIRAGVEKVFLTGSDATGRAVLAQLADRAVPSVMELSGEDPVIVMPGADLARFARALRFGRSLNRGETCIAPRRIIAWKEVAGPVRAAALGLPVSEVSCEEEALAEAAFSPFALGATVFGPEAAARQLAAKLRAGVVVVNDMIVPTADPRLPFGGRGRSGFGVTRGAEGLLEFTVIKAIAVRRGRWLPHLEPAQPGDADLFAGFLAALHGGNWTARLGGMLRAARAGMKRS